MHAYRLTGESIFYMDGRVFLFTADLSGICLCFPNSKNMHIKPVSCLVVDCTVRAIQFNLTAFNQLKEIPIAQASVEI